MVLDGVLGSNTNGSGRCLDFCGDEAVEGVMNGAS